MSDQDADTDTQHAKKRKRSGPKSRTSSFLGVTRVFLFLPSCLGLICTCAASFCKPEHCLGRHIMSFMSVSKQ